MILMGIGLLVMYVIGPVRANFLNAAYGASYSESFFFIHQLISVGLTIAAFIFFSKILKKEMLFKAAQWIMIAAIASCVILALAQVTHSSIAKCELGACRWFAIGSVSLQPAEFVKFALVIYLASIFTEYSKKGKNILMNKDFLIRYILSVGLSLLFVVVVQKDLGSGLPIVVMALATLFVSGVPISSFLLVVLAVLVLGFGAIMTSEHRRARLWTYLGLSSEIEEVEDDAADSYHIENALIAIGTGGLFGVGIGNSVQATGYLPESINDSVFAIMGETFGFIQLVGVLLLFVWLLMRILKVADFSKEMDNNLVAIGAFAWIMTHVVVNIMSMTGITPLTGITLPLLSYGGTSMMATGAVLGVVYQLSQYTQRKVVIDTERTEGNKEDISTEYRRVNYRRRR
jgi:cell division protein FtsW